METYRYTDHMKQVIVASEAASRRYGVNYIGSEFLLLGMLSVPDCTAAVLLSRVGVKKQAILPKIKNIINYDAREIGLTPRTKKICGWARELASESGAYNPLTGTEHMLLAILNSRHCFAVQLIRSTVGDEGLERLINDVVEAVQPDKAKRSERKIHLENKFGEVGRGYKGAVETPKQLDEDLVPFGTDLTERAREGKIDPVIGRNEEIEEVVRILCRRTKNNPVLIGEPGVGKSAVVEGLARAIVAGDVPEILCGKIVFSLNLTGLLAGARYRGDFEERLKKVMEIISRDRDIILFIDEIHMIVGTGGSQDSPMDASNILKPMLARGELQTIGATTVDEYRKFIEKDAALERRFTPVTVEEPSVEDTVAILRGLKDKYEAHHNVFITESAITAAAALSSRYISDRFLPDKAIDLIDEAASRERLASYNGPRELHEITDRLLRLKADYKNALNVRRDEARASGIEREIRTLEKRRQTLASEWENKRDNRELSIDAEDIAKIVSERTGIPVSRLTETEAARLMHLEEELHRRIVGQEEAVTAVSRAIRRARAGLNSPTRPIGSFIFVGPTGVGKTDLAKALSESMFGDEKFMIRLDMSEFMEKNSVNKIIGAPPGYVGYEDAAGQLTERIRKKPYSVVLFDEIEKAHPDVFNLLLQILDDGRLTDNKGRTVSFRNTVIVLTSNVGAHETKEVSALGFRPSDAESAYTQMKDRIEAALKQRFKPEFLNRLDEVIVFRKLTMEEAAEIADKMLSALSSRLKERNIGIAVSARAKSYLVEKGYNEEMGARPLSRTIRKLIEDRLAEEMLKGSFRAGDTVTVDEVNGELVFRNE